MTDKFIRAVGGMALIATVAGCGSNHQTGAGQSTEGKGAADKLTELRAKVGVDAVTKMDRGDFRDTYAKLGKAQFDYANALSPWAALAVAESDQCDRVELVGISQNASRKQIQWYVDCGNKERFQIKQEQAEAARNKFDPVATPDARKAAQQLAVAEPKSARWKGFNEANTVSACDLTVQQAMLVPSSFGTGFNRWDIEKNDDTGIVTIERDFKSENAYSMKINGRYRCVVDIDKKAIVRLSIREPDGWRKLV